MLMTHSGRLHQDKNQKSKLNIINFDHDVSTVPPLCLAPPSSPILEFCTAIAERIKVSIVVFS